MRSKLAAALALGILWVRVGLAQEQTLPARANLGAPAAKDEGSAGKYEAPLARLEPRPVACNATFDGPCEVTDAIPPRWTLRTDIGDGVGYTRGFTYLEGFVPLFQPSDLSLGFGDLRVVNFDEQNRWEFNAGAGYRAYADSIDAVCGLNLFYDGRHTDNHFFHQIGVGGEALFKQWEVRCNGYIIVGDSQKLIGEFTAVTDVGTQVITDRLRFFEVAMGGFDVEAGVHLPVLIKFDPRAYLGFYHYAAEGMPSVNGVRGRLEARLTENCSLHFAVENDSLFDTTVTGGLALHFGGRSSPCSRDDDWVRARLGQRVVRDVNIVIADKVTWERVIKDNGPNIKGDPPPDGGGDPPPPPPGGGDDPPPWHCHCLPFPGAPGDPSTFPGHTFPPGFHHHCFPGRGRYKHLGIDYSCCFDPPEHKEKHED